MQLVEGWAGHLPVMLLVKIAKAHRIRQELIQILDASRANVRVQSDRQSGDLAEGLNLRSMLVQTRAGSLRTRFGEGALRTVRVVVRAHRCLVSYTKALKPVIALPTISVFISRVP